jgi:hypothetical protein
VTGMGWTFCKWASPGKLSALRLVVDTVREASSRLFLLLQCCSCRIRRNDRSQSRVWDTRHMI